MAVKPRLTPRKQPTQARSKSTVDAMLEATRRLLVRSGFDALNTNDVAEVAGVSIGSLYQYFPSKESLIAAALVAHRQALQDALTDALEASAAEGPPHAPAIARAAVDLYRGQEWLAIALPLVHSMDAERKLAPVDQETVETLQAFFETRGVTDAAGDAEVFYAVLLGTLQRLCSRNVALIDEELVEDLARVFAALESD